LISLQNCQQWYRKIYIPKELEKETEEEMEENAIKNGEQVLFINLEEEA